MAGTSRSGPQLAVPSEDGVWPQPAIHAAAAQRLLEMHAVSEDSNLPDAVAGVLASLFGAALEEHAT